MKKLNQEIINYYSIELSKAWLQYSSRLDIENYKLLNSRVKMFGEYVIKQLNLEQLGEKMVVDETQIDCENIKEDFSKAFEETDISFLTNFRDKSDLRYIQKLAEIEISKENSYIGIQLTLILAGASIFLVYAGEIFDLPKFIKYYWIIVGIVILFWGWFFGYLSQFETKGQKKRLKFLHNIILQVERRLH